MLAPFENSDSSLALLDVIAELLAHLADESDPDFRSCLAGIRRLWRHCALVDSEGAPLLQLAPLSWELIAETLLNWTPPAFDATMNEVAGLVNIIATSITPSAFTDRRSQLLLIAEGVRTTEREYAAAMYAAGIAPLGSTEGEWHPHNPLAEGLRRALRDADLDGTADEMLARRILEVAASTTGAIIDSNSEKNVEEVRRLCPTAIQFYRLVVRKIVLDGANVSSGGRSNWVWDADLAFQVGTVLRSGRKPIKVITNDRDLLLASTLAGVPHFVQTLARFIANA
ncbi:MAG: hypothetical protein ABIU97_00980 [Dehalococcoidia bacterium]